MLIFMFLCFAALFQTAFLHQEQKIDGIELFLRSLDENADVIASVLQKGIDDYNTVLDWQDSIFSQDVVDEALKNALDEEEATERKGFILSKLIRLLFKIGKKFRPLRRPQRPKRPNLFRPYRPKLPKPSRPKQPKPSRPKQPKPSSPSQPEPSRPGNCPDPSKCPKPSFPEIIPLPPIPLLEPENTVGVTIDVNVNNPAPTPDP